MANKNISYLNKDFNTFKQDLIEYAKAYYPTAYNDFSNSSPGTMFIDMASYVGDVLSFYLDNQIQETFLEYAKQTNNLYSLAYMLGYRPKVSSAAVVNLDIYQQIPSVGINYQPDFTYAMVLQEGTQVRSNINSSNYFYCPNKIDFTLSSSFNPTDISVYSTFIDPSGNPQPSTYLLKKSTQAISGQVKTTSVTFGSSQPFATTTITDNNIIEIISVYDSNGNIWYEVPYLAQNYILEPVENTAANYPSLYQQANQVPYILQQIDVPTRFVSRFTSPTTLELEFGAGITPTGSVPNPYNVGFGTSNAISLLNTAFDPTIFVSNFSYGLAPSNTTLTITYLAGGGASANVQTNELTYLSSVNATFVQSGNPATQNQILSSIAVNNSLPAEGGGDGDTADQLRQNTLAAFPTQMRAVTQQDYVGFALGMPAKFGQVSKAYVTKDSAVFSQYLANEPGEFDPLATSLYVLGYDTLGNLATPQTALLQNLQTYISNYRSLTDTILIKPAFIINIQVNFDVVLNPNYTSLQVIGNCISVLQDYFNIDKWQINQPIILSNIYSLLDSVAGVQTVKALNITNISGEQAGYSIYSYDIPGATLNGVIYPSLDPSIFAVQYPNIDIQGRSVAF